MNVWSYWHEMFFYEFQHYQRHTTNARNFISEHSYKKKHSFSHSYSHSYLKVVSIKKQNKEKGGKMVNFSSPTAKKRFTYQFIAWREARNNIQTWKKFDSLFERKGIGSTSNQCRYPNVPSWIPNLFTFSWGKEQILRRFLLRILNRGRVVSFCLVSRMIGEVRMPMPNSSSGFLKGFPRLSSSCTPYRTNRVQPG